MQTGRFAVVRRVCEKLGRRKRALGVGGLKTTLAASKTVPGRSITVFIAAQ